MKIVLLEELSRYRKEKSEPLRNEGEFHVRVMLVLDKSSHVVSDGEVGYWRELAGKYGF